MNFYYLFIHKAQSNYNMCDNCCNLNIVMYSTNSVNITGALIYYTDDIKTYVKKCCLLRYYTGNNILKPKFEEKLLDNIKYSNQKRQAYIKLNNELNEIIPVYEFNFAEMEIINHPDDYTNKYKIQINRYVILCKSNEQYVFTTKSQYNKYIKNPQSNILVDENFEYIYLLKDRTAVKSNEDVYKIGKTKQSNLNRFKSYPKGINLLLLIKCINCSAVEKKIMNLFKEKYIHNRDYGNEYFEGNPETMAKDIIFIVFN